MSIHKSPIFEHQKLAWPHCREIHFSLRSVQRQGGTLTHMESPFALPIHIDYRPPASLLILLTIIHAGALVCLLSVSLSLGSKVLLTLIMFCSYLIYTRRYIRARRKPVELMLRPDNEWRLVDRSRGDPHWSRMTLIPGAFVHPRLVVLNLRGPPGKYAFLLTPENVEGNCLRRLRVRLRYPG